MVGRKLAAVVFRAGVGECRGQADEIVAEQRSEPFFRQAPAGDQRRAFVAAGELGMSPERRELRIEQFTKLLRSAIERTP